MSTHPDDSKAATAARPDADEQAARPGLSSDELQAEQAGDLPEREAMSVLSVGGLGIDVPPADRLDDLLNADVSADTSATSDLTGQVDLVHEDGFPFEQVTSPVERVYPLPPVEEEQPMLWPMTGPPSTTPTADDTTHEA